MKKGSKVLVTGSTGFIGRHMVDELIDKKCEVLCLIRPETDTRNISKKNVLQVKADYFNPESLEKAVAGIDYLFHIGAVISGSNKERLYQSNVVSTRNLMNACLKANPGIKKIIYVSSIAAAGPATDRKPVKEEDECHPVSAYGKSKYLAELEVKKFFSELPIVIIRATNILGVYQKQIEDIMKIARKGIVPILGNGDKQTTICFVEDLVRAMIMAAENNNVRSRIYFVADGNPFSWREITDRIVKEMGIKFLIRIPYPVLIMIGFLSEIVSRYSGKPPLISRKRIRSVRNNYWLQDVGKIEKELGFTTETDFDLGIKKIVSWYRDSGRIKSP